MGVYVASVTPSYGGGDWRNQEFNAALPPPSPEVPVWLVMPRLLPPSAEIFDPGRPDICHGNRHFHPPYDTCYWAQGTMAAIFQRILCCRETSLRGLWGSMRHQNNRETTSTFGRSAAAVLGVPKQSMIRVAPLTLSALFFPGIIQMGMIPPQPQSLAVSANSTRLHVAGSFWAQIPPFGIEVTGLVFVAWYCPKMSEWSATEDFVVTWAAA